jgi:hypothetical protein
MTNYELTKILIKMLHKCKKYNLDPYDFCKIFELADMLLMDDDIINVLLKYLDANIDTIINYELYKNNVNNLCNLLEHLKNIYYTDNEFMADTKKLSYQIYKKIIELDFDIKISNDDNWKLLSLLNVKIPLVTGFEILKVLDFANDIYADIQNMTKFGGTDIYLKPDNCIVTNKTEYVQKIIILNEWFPIFKVDIFEKFHCKITEINNCNITLTIGIDNNVKLKKDAKLLFGFNVSSYPKNIYNIKEIVKCLGDKKVNVPYALHINNLNIYYEITLDRFCDFLLSDISKQPVWLMTQIEHKVECNYL